MDKHGRCVRFLLLPSNTAEVTAFKGFDSHKVRALLAALGLIAVIPPRVHRKDRDTIPCDREAYQARHLIANVFADCKPCRGIAYRTCKLAATFTGLLDLVSWFIGIRRTAQQPALAPCPAGLTHGRTRDPAGRTEDELWPPLGVRRWAWLQQ